MTFDNADWDDLIIDPDLWAENIIDTADARRDERT